MRAEELLPVLAIAEGFGAPGTSSGERSCEIAGGQARAEISVCTYWERKPALKLSPAPTASTTFT